MDQSYSTLPNDAVEAANGVSYTYRDTGGHDGTVPLAQELTLRRPALVRRLVLASSAPKGAAGMHGWAPSVIGAVGTPKTSPEEYLGVFFAPSAASQQAGKEALGRMYARTENRDGVTTWATREAQYDRA